MNPLARRTVIPAVVVLIVVSGLLAAGCGAEKKSSPPKKQAQKCAKAPSREPEQLDGPPPASAVDANAIYTATLTTSEGDMEIKLDPKVAPNAVANFVYLARKGFYKDVAFHRIIKDFMVQTGDPSGTGTGGPGYTIKGDAVKSPYKRGTLAMANTGSIDSGGSQFFIIHQDYDLPPNYSIFGQVTTGLDTLDAIAETEVTAADGGEPSSPTCAVVLKNVTIDGPELRSKQQPTGKW